MLLTATPQDLGAGLLAAAIVLAFLLLLTAPVSGLERYLARRAYGISRADVRSGRIRFVRSTTGQLVPVDGDDVTDLLPKGWTR